MSSVEFHVTRARDVACKVAAVGGSSRGVMRSGNNKSWNIYRSDGFARVEIANGGAVCDVTVGVRSLEHEFGRGDNIGRLCAIVSGKPSLHHSARNGFHS